MDAELHPQALDAAVAELATRQGGLIARRQLQSLGLPRGAIEHRIARGRLHHVAGHRGVFAVGHTAPGRWTRPWAAHLAVGPHSVLSHRSAATAWDLRAAPARVELTVCGPSRRRSSVLVHRTTWLPPHDLTALEGLPITTVARTLVDLGAVAAPRQVERAYDRAEVLRLLDHAAVARVLRESATRPGAAALRGVLARESPGAMLTETDIEELMLELLRRARLPEPLVQHPVLGFHPDFCWPDARLIVETDGRAGHATAVGHAQDARRDVRLQNAGWRVLRFVWSDLVADPGYVEAAIREALART